MNKDFKIPPKLVGSLTSGEQLAEYFKELISNKFVLTGKTRTDGSNIRKLIASVLEKHPLPKLAQAGHYEIVPPKGKGIPKITREFIDTYIVTSGSSYNLQVWNRIPAVDTLLITYESGENLKCTDVKFVFVRINMEDNTISSIVILTPSYIENKFGKFGKPTIKQQLLISGKIRKKIIDSESKIIIYKDSKKIATYVRNDYLKPIAGMTDEPIIENLFSIELLHEVVANKLIGFKLSDLFYAIFHQYYLAYQDNRAERLAKYIKYGTEDSTEIWMLRYGFSFEEIEWLKPCVESIDQTEIRFNGEIESLDDFQRSSIAQYLF